MGKDSYFIGFDGFEAKKDLWNQVFSAFDGWAELRNIFAISKQLGFSKELDIDATQLNRRLSGSEGWGMYGDNFLSYRKNPEQYQACWMPHAFVPAEWIAIFRSFIRSVPDNFAQCTQVQQKFWEPAREVCGYLRAVIQYCQDPLPQDGRDWISAGMYVLICLFLQNGKRARPQFYEPPAPYTLAQLKKVRNQSQVREIHVALPKDQEMAAPEQDFSLWAYLRRAMEQREKADDWDPWEEERTPVISPAVIRRQRTTLRKAELCFPLYPDFSSGVFVSRQIPVWDRGQWRVISQLVRLPWEQRKTGEDFGRVRLEETVFEDDPQCSGVLLAANSWGSYRCVHFSVYREGLCMGANQDWDVLLLELNEDGLPRNREAERVLGTQGILQDGQEKKSITWTCGYDPEYLRCQLIDPDTMELIPIRGNQDPASGEYRCAVTLLCPCRVAVLKQRRLPEAPQWGTRLALAGYYHGLYGFHRDREKARAMMQQGALADDPYMAFEFGAFLKEKGSVAIAADFLSLGAEHGIPGAIFELAQLRLEQGNTEQAKSLLGSLWERGYRSYGGVSIDLLGEYT